MVTDVLLVTAGAMNTTVGPVVLSKVPPVTVHVIVPPATAMDPYFTLAVNAIMLPA